MKYLKKFNDINELWINDKVVSIVKPGKDEEDGKELLKEIEGFYLNPLKRSDIKLDDETEKTSYKFYLAGKNYTISIDEWNGNTINIYQSNPEDYVEGDKLDISKSLSTKILNKVRKIYGK